MKLAVAALIRNEIDIISAFLQHLDALFDHAVLMDHGSIDGTPRMIEQACARRPGWTMWHVESAGYHQTAYTETALHHLMRHTDADFVLLLDADEFIAVRSRTELETALSHLADPDRLGRLQWRNVVPQRLDARTINADEPLWCAPAAAPLGKAVVPRPFWQRHGQSARLANGNHGLFFDPKAFIPSDAIGELLHLPVRSHEQLRNKTLAGVFAVMAQGRRDPRQSSHWFDVLWRIADRALSDEDLIGLAARYGEPQPIPMPRAELQARGFTKTTLNVAWGRPLPASTEPPSTDPVRLVATILRRFQIEDVLNGDLILDGNRLRFVPRESRS